MKIKEVVLGLLVLGGLVSCQKQEYSKEAVSKEKLENIISHKIEKMTNKEKAIAFIDAVNKNDKNKIVNLLTEDYIQHNPNVPTGRNAMLGMLPIFNENGMKIKVIRAIEDGEYVILHTLLTNAKPLGADELVTFDIFKFNEDGKMTEHWDALMPNVIKTASGRSLIDGPIEIKDLDKTLDNKKLVSDFVAKILIGGERDLITNYISSEKYNQHNPHVKDGLNGLFEALESGNIKFEIKKAHAIFAEGDFVLTVNEGLLNDEAHAFYDLFHIEDNKITEHWDITPAIPSEGMANDNTLFNFK